jgi:hypothetical protein
MEPPYISLSECVEHEDGSVTYKVDMEDKARDTLVEEGLKLVLYCAAYEVDLGDVYDWIESQGKSIDIPKISEFTPEERQRAIERSVANGEQRGTHSAGKEIT